MENVHHAIAWYQTKIGSYDKQLWEQSVEKKLQKQPPFVLHNAPRKKVRLKTEYIDVDLIRGSTFAKTKPQVPWVYITRKAIARVLFFPFYYTWWVHQTSKRLYALLLVLYVLQVATVLVYLRNVDHSIMEDEMCFTEVVLPIIFMFLLCLIHSQTVLAHINHKPPKRTKNISGVTRKPHPRKATKKGRSSGNNSTCQEDGVITDNSRSSRRRSSHQSPDVDGESQPLSSVSESTTKKDLDPTVLSSSDSKKTLESHSISEHIVQPKVNSVPKKLTVSSTSLHTTDAVYTDVKVKSNWHQDTCSGSNKHNAPHDKKEIDQFLLKNQKMIPHIHNSESICSKQNVTAEKAYLEISAHSSDISSSRKELGEYSKDISDCMLESLGLNSEDMCNSVKTSCVQCQKASAGQCSHGCIDADGHIGETCTSVTGVREHMASSSRAATCAISRAQTNEDIGLSLDIHGSKHLSACSNIVMNSEDSSKGVCESSQNECPVACDILFESPSGSDNLSMSDFEVVDHHVARDRYSSDQDAQPTDLSADLNIQSWEADLVLQNSTDVASGAATTINSGVSHFRPRPFESQDSSDSGINNEVTFGDFSCVKHHKDAANVSLLDNVPGQKCPKSSTSGFEDGISSNFACLEHPSEFSSQSSEETPVCYNEHLTLGSQCNVVTDLSSSFSDSNSPQTVKAQYLSQKASLSDDHHDGNNLKISHQSSSADISDLQSTSLLLDENLASSKDNDSHDSVSPNVKLPMSEPSSKVECFSETFVQEILNEDTLREISCSSLLVHSDLENSSSSVGRLSTASLSSSASSSSCCRKVYDTHHIPQSSKTTVMKEYKPGEDSHESTQSKQKDPECQHDALNKAKNDDEVDEKNDPLDESLEHLNASDGERPSDDVSNYNASDSDAESDGPVNDDICIRDEEKWKRLRFQEHAVGSDSLPNITTSKASTHIANGEAMVNTGNGSVADGSGSRSVVGILTRKPSPLKDLAIGRKSSSNVPVTNSSGSDPGLNGTRNQLRRRRRTSGTPTEIVESNKSRSVPNSLGLNPTENKVTHISSSENETGGAHTPEGSNKATVSSEEWEDRMQSDETTSSAYSSNSEEVDSEGKTEEDEKTEYTTSTLNVINLLQPSGSPSSSGNLTQPDRVSCLFWEGNECKKVDLTALDIGWAIIDKVDGLPESSDYFIIGLLFSFLISLVPLVFRAYISKDAANIEDLLSWSGLLTRCLDLPSLIRSSYTWRQYLLMVNGMLQRFFLSLIFFFLLSVADRTFKQRLLYAKHFSYLTSSRRARKFSMPHFRLNKVRNIKIWLSLRSYLKRRGPQRSVDVIVSACFLCAVCAVCLISLQMLKDTSSYLDYLCNWELLIWCTALAVFLMRFMTVGLKINKKYRNLSVLITEQINLYLQMEQKPHKKEELILANNVLRLAEDLLKELESPFKISGFSANPLIYNIMRVVVLSAFSAVLTEVLGFKLKLHKIKLKG
ncbi:hypothetical protein BsWGS_24089 [Bradybaena similaris]